MPDWFTVVGFFKDEFCVIAAAKVTFIAAAGFIFLVAWLIIQWLYKARVDGKDTTIQTQQAHIAFLTAQAAGRGPEQAEEPTPPNYERWAFVPVLAFWQIAWLWVDREPMLPLRPGTPAYPVLQMLKADARRSELPHQPSPEGTINVWAWADREDLKRYAEKKGHRPKFLFDR